MTRRLLVIALGEAEGAARILARERFPGAQTTVFQRGDLVKHPLAALRRLRGTPWDDVLLVAPSLGHPRLQLTALLLAIPVARRRWLGDLTGRLEPFTLGLHLVERANLWRLPRHLLGMGLARLLFQPLLFALLAVLKRERRRPRWGRPHRILYLRSQLWFGLTGGGSVGHTAGVIRGLQASGVEVHAVASDRLHGVGAPVEVVAPEVWFDGAARDLEEALYNLPFLRSALAAARRFRPDALYQRYTALNVGGVLLARVLRVPLVLEFNSSDVWKARHWGEFHWLGAAELAERVNLEGADLVVVVSRVLRDTLVEAGVPIRKILLNPNGVDPEQFRTDVDSAPVRQKYRLGERLVVGFSGTFGVWHGIPTLAAALPRLAATLPDARFLLVGDGPLRHTIDTAVESAGIQEQVILPGLVPHARMPEYLAACDVLLSPHGRQADGRAFFGSPTKLYEYMAAGKAIVASDTGQIGEVLTDSQTALLVAPDDTEALTRAVLRLAGDAPLRARLGAAARRQAETEHTWRRNAERVLDAVQRGTDG